MYESKDMMWWGILKNFRFLGASKQGNMFFLGAFCHALGLFSSGGLPTGTTPGMHRQLAKLAINACK